MVIIGLRLSPFLRFFWPLLLFAAMAAVVATFCACDLTAFLMSEPFIMARVAAEVANSFSLARKGDLWVTCVEVIVEFFEGESVRRLQSRKLVETFTVTGCGRGGTIDGC